MAPVVEDWLWTFSLNLDILSAICANAKPDVSAFAAHKPTRKHCTRYSLPKQPIHASQPHTAISAYAPFFRQPPASSQPDQSCSHVCVTTRAGLHWRHTCSDSRKQRGAHTSEGPPRALFLDAPGKSAACHASNYQLINNRINNRFQRHPYSRPITKHDTPRCTITDQR